MAGKGKGTPPKPPPLDTPEIPIIHPKTIWASPVMGEPHNPLTSGDFSCKMDGSRGNSVPGSDRKARKGSDEIDR